jgi:hypothetical protein
LDRGEKVGFMALRQRGTRVSWGPVNQFDLIRWARMPKRKVQYDGYEKLFWPKNMQRR